jgi:shikimate dehydrogenase
MRTPSNSGHRSIVWTIEDLRRSPSGRLPPDLRLGVLGDPVGHSLSPEMQNAGLVTRKLPFQYGKLLIKGDELGEAFALLRSLQFVGWNLTVPHKIAGCDLVEKVDPRAARFGAINTVVNRSGSLIGLNTDGIGLITALRESFSLELAKSRVAVLGAGGGAGLTAALSLWDQNPERLLLTNRTPAKLDRLRGLIGNDDKVSFLPWDQLDQAFAGADLIVNASSAGLAGETLDWDRAWLRHGHRIFDMQYGARPTPLMKWAESAGIPAVNGAIMLLHQGTAAFEHWFGPPVPESAMRLALGLGPAPESRI